MTKAQNGTKGVGHLVDDVRRFGLFSAASIVDRYIEAVDRALAHSPFTPSSSPWERLDVGVLIDGAERAAEAGTRVLDAIAAIIDGSVQGTDTQPGDRLVLPATRPGASSEVSLWVHNPTSTAAASVDLYVTALASSTGRTVPIGAVSLAPARLELLEASSRQEVRVRVRVPANQAAGHYHGLVLSSAAPSEPLPLRLEVQAPGGQGP